MFAPPYVSAADDSVSRRHAEVELLHSIYDDAWEHNWGHVKMEREEFSYLADGFKGFLLLSLFPGDPELQDLAVKPGDIVQSVNGQPVGNIQQDRHQLDNILAEGSARIEVQRGTRRFFVTASLKQ